MALLVDAAKPTGATSLAVIASICSHILSLAVPLALLQTYDRILPNEAYSTTFVLAIGVSAAIFLEALLRYGRAVLFAHIGAAFESRTTLQLVDHVMRSNSKAVHAHGTPALLDAVRAIGQVRDYWSGNAAATLHELPFVAIYILLIAYIGSWLALIPIVLTLVALLAAMAVARDARRAVQDIETADNSRRDLVWGIFTGLPHAKAMAAEPTLTRWYRDVVARSMDANARVENHAGLIRENGALLSQLATIAIVTFGAFMVISGELTIGGLAACTLLAGRSIGPAMGAFSYLIRLPHRDAAQHKISEVLSLPRAPLWASEHGERPFRGGTIEISGPPVPDGPVAIAQGEVVRIAGPDHLITSAALDAIGQLDDSLGLGVTFDGLPASAFDSQSLKNSIATISATTPMIRGTLLDNFTLFSPQFEAEAIRLMQRLGLDSFVDSLRQGLMTPVGPAGAEVVSPGVGIRIGLIRALVRHPAILCLDEVGGALDLDGKRRLLDILNELKGHTTIFLVSRDPSLLQLVDKTIRIAHGTRS